MTTHAAAAERLLTPKDLANRWARSPRTLANMRSRGEGPPYLKINGFSVRYRLAEVEAYEDEALTAAPA